MQQLSSPAQRRNRPNSRFLPSVRISQRLQPPGYLQRHRGVTLIEMLISVTLSLMLVFAVVQIFQTLGDAVSVGRATIEMSGQLRTVSNRLQNDLDQLTCPVRAWMDPAKGAGYFRYVEGVYQPSGGSNKRLPQADYSWMVDRSSGQVLATTNGLNDFSQVGDLDDRLAMTVRSRGEPFRSGTWTSQIAEVVWWVAIVDTNNSGSEDPNDTSYLMRREFLVLPTDSATNDRVSPDQQVPSTWPHTGLDVSCRYDGSYWVANAVSDLTTPDRRVYHYASSNADLFPRLITAADWPQYSQFAVLSDVMAFDVRAYSPAAPIYTTANPATAGTTAVLPGEVGYYDAFLLADDGNWAPASLGAFVDLGYRVTINEHFQARGSDSMDMVHVNNDVLAEIQPSPGFFTQSNEVEVAYDTWTLAYERNGADDDGDGLTDEGFDNVDNDDINGVDDLGERESPPPYRMPLRGLEVRIRMMEPSTGQVRQVSVVSNFMPK